MLLGFYRWKKRVFYWSKRGIENSRKRLSDIGNKGFSLLLGILQGNIIDADNQWNRIEIWLKKV
jgi:hypothetical protein